MVNEAIKVLDHGYVKLIETYGYGEAGVPEAGIIEAARQSTQGNFRSWAPYELCESCGYWTREGLQMPEFPDHKHDMKKFPRGDEGLLSFLFNNKPPHATPFEFAGMVIEIRAPIAVFREWHRHRTQSYNEMSARYAPLPDMNYMPTVERCFTVQAKNKQAQAMAGAAELTHDVALAWLERLAAAYELSEQVYREGLNIGIPKEVARMCVPVGRYTQMRAATNLRNWLAFLTLRMHPDAQWEIRQFANVVGEIISQQFPKTWNLFDLSRPK